MRRVISTAKINETLFRVVKGRGGGVTNHGPTFLQITNHVRFSECFTKHVLNLFRGINYGLTDPFICVVFCF